jgi:hypothetical protein
MKKIFFTLLFLLVVIVVKAQEDIEKEQVIKNVNDIGVVLLSHYHPNPDSVKNACWEGCVLIRFTIGADRQFSKIAFTATTPVFIKEALSKAFLSLNEKGMKVNRLSEITGRTYILPAEIIHKDGCGFMSGWEDANYKPDEKMAPIYARRQEYFDQNFNSIWNMLNFSDGRVGMVDCILLSPAMTGIGMY